MTKRLFLCFLTLLTVIPTHIIHPRQKDEESSVNKLTVLDIEKSLLELINQERSKNNLPPLRFSSALHSLAKAHSQDMAKHNVITHGSLNGNTYADRLAAERILFQKAGENVGFSETFVAEFIHESFMESSEHRETILDTDFDHIGIGISYAQNKGYFITQDFIRSYGPELLQAREEAKEGRPFKEALEEWLLKITQDAQTEIQRIKKENSLDPFVFIEEANEHAAKASERKTAGISMPPLPEKLQQIHIFFVFITAGTLESVLPDFSRFKNPLYQKGGIGIRFGRNKENPGGALFITLVLMVEKEFSTMAPQELNNFFLEKINIQRNRKGICPLRVNAQLSKQAEVISKNMVSAEDHSLAVPPHMMNYHITSFVTHDPLNMPQEIEALLTEKEMSVIGLGVVYTEDKNLSKRDFYFTIIY